MKKLSALIAVVFASASWVLCARYPPRTPVPARRPTAPRPRPPKRPKPRRPPRRRRKSRRKRPKKRRRKNEESDEVPAKKKTKRKPSQDRRRESRREARRGSRQGADSRARQGRQQEVIAPALKRRGLAPRLFFFQARRNRSMKSSSACRAASIRRSRRWLLKQQGYDVVGLFMKNWEDDDDRRVLLVARRTWSTRRRWPTCIGIEIEAVNFAAEYQERVFARFPARVPGRPHAQPGRAVQRRDQVPGLPRPRDARWAPTASRPATTRGCASVRRPLRTAQGAWTRPRTRATSCTG